MSELRIRVLDQRVVALERALEALAARVAELEEDAELREQEKFRIRQALWEAS